MTNNLVSMFPTQKLSLKKKNEEWGEACVNYIIGMGETVPSGYDRTNFEEMQTYYDLYNSIFDQKDLQYVTDPYKQSDGFPASPQNFNIIRPKIDLLLGEETKHPFNFRVIRTSQDATSEVQDKMKKMLSDYIMADVVSSMSEKEAQLYQEKLSTGEILPPESINRFISREYKDVAEECAYHSLNYLKEKLSLNHEFYKGWKDALIAGKEVYYTGIINGEPHLERVNPIYFAHDNSPDLEFIEDGDWAVRRMRMSYTEVYDRLYDKMNEKQLDKLLEMTGEKPAPGSYGKEMPSAVDYVHLDMKVVGGPGNDNLMKSNHVNMWHVTWKSYKKVGFVTTADENGEPQEIMVSEDYMITGMELDIEWKWIIEVWEGYRIGVDLFVGIQPLEYQSVSVDNPNSQKLPYCGVLYSNTNSQSKSLVSIMKPLQYMYIIIWYRLELALARDKGKVINMDITQIPKSMNIDAAKWMHYLSAVGVNFINPYEEGWDIPGREGGKPSAFNQITALDLTMANVIDQYINLMSKIEDMISEISGVSRQRQGSINTSELVGNVERSVIQSANITEPLFWMHGQCKKNSLRLLLNTAKEAWRDSKRRNIQYVMDDSTRTFMNLSENFFYEDYDIFVSDSTKDLQNLEAIKTLYQPAMQNGASILDIAEIMTLDSVSSIKAKLAKIEKTRAEQQQQAADQENQRQMQLSQANQMAQQEANQIKQQELELDKYKIDSDNQTKIYVAELNAYKGQSELDADQNGIPDVMEIADMSIKRMQHDADVMNKQMIISQKERDVQEKHNIESKKVDMQAKIEHEKINLEKQKLGMEKDRMAHETKLQQLKDKAAMSREELKAKTVLKNKTVGER
jgi:hypothetical protein